MKQFIVDRHTTPNTPTLEQVPTEKIPVYEDMTAVAADLANLAENQIIATHDTGSELSAPVDVVQSGNMHAVTSNAVAVIIDDTIKIHSFTKNINIQSNDDTNVSINLSSVSGYTPIFITSIHPSVNNNNAITVQGFWIENDTATIAIGNRGSIVLSGNLTIKIGYVKNKLI